MASRVRRWGVRGLAAIAVAGGLAILGERALAAWIWHRLELRPQPAKVLPAGIPSLSASTCGGCHPEQHAAWSASRMGRAMTDPVFLEDWEAQDRVFVCRTCHSPLLEQQPTVVTGLRHVLGGLAPIEEPNPAYRPELVEEGVTCVACHLVDGWIVGPDGDRGPHPVRGDPTFRSATRCEGCHQVAIPPLADLDRPISDTHGEWEAWKALTGRTETCVDCHMPGRRHTFPGAWDAELLRSGLGVTVRAEGAELVVTLENRAGHRFPSADPARALVVRAGAAEVVLARLVPLPTMRDDGDTTLAPGETRALRLPRDGDEVVVEMQPLRFLANAPSREAVEIGRFAVR